MFALRVTSTSSIAKLATATQARYLSSQGFMAVEKLRNVFEEYRQLNYTQETPTRFKKDIIRAAAGSVSSAEAALHKDIAAKGLQRVLANIGAAERLSPAELQMIFSELGNERGEIPAKNFIQLL